jgi:molybdopterin synthase catalytic subunit
MTVTVRLFARVRELAGTNTHEIELPEGSVVSDLRHALAGYSPAAATLIARSAVAVNGEYAADDRPLSTADEIALIPPVSGGAGATPMVRISHDPIDHAALTEAVRRPGCGAVVTFLGTVRDLTGDEVTEALEYEAYPMMAERSMAEIGAAVKSGWQVGDIALVHRLGRLGVGEISVAVAVSAPHRGDAFSACRYAIDRLKEVVPIWKKDISPTRSEWMHPDNSPEAK